MEKNKIPECLNPHPSSIYGRSTLMLRNKKGTKDVTCDDTIDLDEDFKNRKFINKICLKSYQFHGCFTKNKIPMYTIKYCSRRFCLWSDFSLSKYLF